MSAFSPRSAFIPLVGSADVSGRIARIQADGSVPDRNEAGLNPSICELADWHLYEAGAVALGAIARLELRPGKLALVQRVRPRRVRASLSVTNGPDIVGLDRSSTASAELGLALALLMYRAQSTARTVVATGRLARGTDPQDTSDDVQVLPVDGLAAKLRIVERSLDTHRGAAQPARMHCFVPGRTRDGTCTRARYDEEIRRLENVFARRGIDLEVVPVATLRDAVASLGIKRLETTRADRWLAAGLMGLALAAIVGASLMVLRSLPIDLAFAPIETDAGARIATPSPSVYDPAKGRYVAGKVCRGAQNLPVYRNGESLVVRVRVVNGSRVTEALGGYHLALVSVSERSGVKVFPPSTFGARGTARAAEEEGAEMSIVLPIEGPLERNKLIVLARRFRPFDAAHLRETLSKVTAEAAPEQRINAAVGRLAGLAPGYLDYSFLTGDVDTPCHRR